ncbi:MAG: SRPBCC family protein [Chthoniobacter sp.]|nr:SRPBCC family protein [Chthoniobacter sp.]
MTTDFEFVGASVEVNLPVADIFRRWGGIENFPHFMTAVREIRWLEGDRFYWRVERAGREYESVIEVTLRIPERRIAWRTISGTESAGVVSFEATSDKTARVSFEMRYATDAGWNDPSELLRRIKIRLEEFRNLVESTDGA